MKHQKNHQTAAIGRGMIYSAWILALLLLTWLFNNYLENQDNPNRSLADQDNSPYGSTVTLKQNRQGHYLATGKINGQKVTLLLDTGATIISIPGNLAKQLNLPFGQPHRVRTANGDTVAYQTRLESVQLGSIQLHGLKASIAPEMSGNQVLLGMNFMKQLELIQRNNELTLRQL